MSGDLKKVIFDVPEYGVAYETHVLPKTYAVSTVLDTGENFTLYHSPLFLTPLFTRFLHKKIENTKSLSEDLGGISYLDMREMSRIKNSILKFLALGKFPNAEWFIRNDCFHLLRSNTNPVNNGTGRYDTFLTVSYTKQTEGMSANSYTINFIVSSILTQFNEQCRLYLPTILSSPNNVE